MGYRLVYSEDSNQIIFEEDGIDIMVVRADGDGTIRYRNWKMRYTFTTIILTYEDAYEWLFSVREIKDKPRNLCPMKVKPAENDDPIRELCIFMSMIGALVIATVVFLGGFLYALHVMQTNPESQWITYNMTVQYYLNKHQPPPLPKVTRLDTNYRLYKAQLCDEENLDSCVRMVNCTLMHGNDMYPLLSFVSNKDCHLYLLPNGVLGMQTIDGKEFVHTGTADRGCTHVTVDKKNLVLHCSETKYFYSPK